MPRKKGMDAIFIVRRTQEEYQNKYMWFVDTENALDRVPRKVKWATKKKSIPEIMVQAVVSLYDSTKTKVRVESAYSEEFKKRLVYIKDL